jgi:uncharacterized OB-fold protein
MSTPYVERTINDPSLNPGDGPYFDGAAEGYLLIKTCNACHQPHHYPRALCPFCWSADVVWTKAAGTGAIYTYSITRRGAGAPYCIAYVQLDEGPTLLTNIVNVDLDEVRIDQRVRVVFKKTEGGMFIPMFTPDTTMTSRSAQ